jgi:hypothetical protein
LHKNEEIEYLMKKSPAMGIDVYKIQVAPFRAVAPCLRFKNRSLYPARLPKYLG